MRSMVEGASESPYTGSLLGILLSYPPGHPRESGDLRLRARQSELRAKPGVARLFPSRAIACPVNGDPRFCEDDIVGGVEMVRSLAY